MPADDEIFLAVAGRGVDCAGALFERDVIAQDARANRVRERDAGRRRLRARRPENARLRFWIGAKPQLRRVDVQQILGDDVDVACCVSTATYSNFGWKAMAMLAGMVQGVVVQIRP